MSDLINIPSLFNGVTDLMKVTIPAVVFDYGHYNEITARLLEKENSRTQKDKKYPLFWLVMDFKEVFPVSMDYYCELPDLQIIIATATKQESSTRERMETTFANELYPAYSCFKKALVDSNFFHDLHEDAVPHEKIDRPYWGGEDSAGKANMFNDYIDAIQIRKLKLYVNHSLPNRFKLFGN